MDLIDREEYKTIAKYLQGKFDDLSKSKRNKTTGDEPKQLLQMINTITRALAIDSASKNTLPIADINNNEVSVNCETCKSGDKLLGKEPCCNCRLFNNYEQLIDC